MLKRDIIATFTANTVGLFLSLVTSIIIARALGPAERGLLGLALLVPSLMVSFCTVGQPTVNIIFAGLYKDKQSSLFQQSLIFTLFGSVISTIAIYAFYFWLPIQKGLFGQLGTDIVRISCLFAPVLMLHGLMTSLLRGVGRTTTAAVIYIVQTSVFLLLLVIFLIWLGGRLKTALALTALNPLVTVVLSIVLLRDCATLRWSKFSVWLLKKSLRFGAQISIASLAGFLIYRIDQGILAYMVPASQVGLYIVAVALAEQVRLLPNSIAVAFLPRLTNELSDRQAQVPMVFRCTVVVSIGSMLLAGILGIPAIMVFYGRAYWQSIPSFLLLLPGIASLGGSSILASDLASREKPQYSVWISYVSLIVNIILNFVLIPSIGIAGAAVASSIAYTLDGILWLASYKYVSGTPLREMIPQLKDTRDILSVIISMIRQAMHRAMPNLKLADSTDIKKC